MTKIHFRMRNKIVAVAREDDDCYYFEGDTKLWKRDAELMRQAKLIKIYNKVVPNVRSRSRNRQ